MIKDFLKRPYLWLFLWIGFFLLIFLCPVGKAELKTFYKGYPWGTTDTSSASNQRELAWERSKGFSFVLEGMADIGGIRILYDRPAIIMYYYDGDTAAFNAWAITRPGKIDSMYAWITRNSYYIDSCYLHWDSTRVYTSIFLEAYDDTNDLDADGIRDFDSYAGFVNIQGFNYIVDSSANWTTNEWIGKGIYDLAGNLIDTVIYNSPETLYYNVMDTTNFVTNWSFETGDSLPTGWLRHGTGRLERTTETAFDDSYSIKVNGNATYGDVAVKQLSIQTPLHCLYVFQASYKTDADFNGTHSHVLLGVLRGGNEGYALNSYFVPSESADGNWHTYRDTFTNYETGAWRESMVVYLGAFPAAEGDTTWNTDDSIYFDAIKLFSINGSLPTWGQFGDFWESKYYYPFIIDSLGIYNHTATAQVESLTRISPWVEYDLGLYTLLANTHYEGYRNFQKWWCGKIFDIRASEGFDGIFEDESWSYTPELLFTGATISITVVA